MPQKNNSKRKSKRGASRMQKKPKNNWQFWKFLAIACVPIALIVLLLNLNLVAPNPAEVAVKKVNILGELNYVDRDVVIERISGQLEGGFFTVDLRAIQKSLEAEPWIESVAIKRIWPSTLEIDVKEHQVVAHWGKQTFVTQKAELLKPDQAVKISGLPYLEGEEKNLQEIWQQYQHLAKELAHLDLHITHLRHGADGSWLLTTDKGFKVVFGAEKLDDRLTRFQLVYEKSLKARVMQVGRVDLRYSNGVAVEWQEPAGQVVQSIR